MGNLIALGGGICGLAAAQMFADDGHDVTVIERDAEGPPSDANEAFEWKRRGVAQFGLGHWMQARGSSIVRQDLPRTYELLLQNGGLEFNLVNFLLSMQPDASPEAEDARFDQLTARRSTLEWAFATAATEHQGITIRRGEAVAGLLSNNSGPVPHVTGVRLESGEELTADLVIDVTGRRSQTPEMLAAIGAAAPFDDGADSGFAYYGRYFRSADGTTPGMIAPLLTPYGSFSILTLPADNGTWSVTLYGLSDDKPLRRFRDPDVVKKVLDACPLHAHWLDGEPLSEIQTMVGGVDRHREFVIDGVPCATGLLSVGDASSCTNPSLGRGMTLGLMHVALARACVAEHLDDPAALALAFHERTEAELHPYHEATVATDRRRVRDMMSYRDGLTPQPTPEEHVADALMGSATRDQLATRSFGDIYSCNAVPSEVMARPGMLEHALGLAKNFTAQPLPGPDRSELLELVS